MQVVDLHSHFPMHLLAGDVPAHPRLDTVALMTRRGGSTYLEKLQRTILHLASRRFNYQGLCGSPAVTPESLRASPIRVALSVLYDPFDEIRFDGAPPKTVYFEDLLNQLHLVDRYVRDLDQKIRVVKTPAQLQQAIQDDDVALIHAVEGGFHLGTERDVPGNIAALAAAGVAYITVAHLFYRGVATNAPAIPFLPDWSYHLLFHQPKQGLTPLGKTLLTHMLARGILIDLTHMSREGITATLDFLDQQDPGRTVPVLASHAACHAVAKAEYNLADDHIRRIAERRGVIGLIACQHWMAKGSKAPATIDDTTALLIRHIEHLNGVAQPIPGRESYETIGIGSDQDGFIKPAMAGLETPQGYAQVIAGLLKTYDEATVRRICWSNALEVLHRGWTRPF